MTDLIGLRLETRPACMVQAHGVFARGASLEEAFFLLCLSEQAGQVIFFAEVLGADLALLRRMVEDRSAALEAAMPPYSPELNSRVDFADEPDTVEMFLTQGRRVFESRYSPFHTGSMSIRGSRTLLYAARASMPRGLPGPLLELPLEPGGPEDALLGAELSRHRKIYRETPLKAVVHCHPAEVEAMALAMRAGKSSETPKIIPIDAEGGFLYPSVPVLPPESDPGTLCRALLDYRMAALAHDGVWAAGEQAVGEALRHVSSIKDICFYRIMAKMRKLDLGCMEPDRARGW
jgi:ribulose-5-phosphate 4-epimerase/fuculose-1-phosphate aldolase